MKTGKIVLVVDDEAEIRKSLEEILSEGGLTVLSAGSVNEALALHHQKTADCAIVDIMLGRDDGMDLLKKLREEQPDMPVIMITGQGTVSLAAEAFRLGAHDFLEKPLRLVQVRTCVRNALEKVSLKKTLTLQALSGRETPIHVSARMKALYAQTVKLAGLRVPVMILGSSGSGKELVARTLHFAGTRATGPFVATNAAALPVNLAEDELFGHERGAFTGAHAGRTGRLEEADNGTLFLDEIADMDSQVQAKLLRVIETNEFSRLGSGTSVPVDVRIVCATHKDIPALIKAGKFREDLWYRLSAFVLSVPPLSERPEDIPLLADHFLLEMCKEVGTNKRFTPDGLSFLQTHPFPGNVRELKHVVSRAAVFCETEEISAVDLKDIVNQQGKPSALSQSALFEINDFQEARLHFEKSYLKRMLDLCKGNITLTAQKIGMAQSNLSRKLKELGLR